MADLHVLFPKPCSEPWEGMALRDCSRRCAACDKIIHDLSLLSFDEADSLLRSGGEACVRAIIGGDGTIAIRNGENREPDDLYSVVKGRKRCRMHGGTNPGAPNGNRNAWRHGARSAGAEDAARYLREIARLAVNYEN